MEVLQQSVASGGLQCVAAVGASDTGASSSRHRARVSLSRRVLSCQGFAISSSTGSLRHNALAGKVFQVAGKSYGHRAVVAMSGIDTAAGGYASALADLAQSTDTLEKVNCDVEKLGEYLNSPEVYDFLVSPIIEDEKKKSILKTLSEDGSFNEFTLSFLNLLVDKKRIGLIKEVLKEFESIFNNLTDTQVAVVTSAVKIESAQLALIAKKVQSLSGAQNVRLKNVVDPSLIAGFVVKYGKDGSRFIDMSVKGQLDKLATQFENAEKVGSF